VVLQTMVMSGAIDQKQYDQAKAARVELSNV
jgi:membrane peptidoglycan carboxypeptidase